MVATELETVVERVVVGWRGEPDPQVGNGILVDSRQAEALLVAEADAALGAKDGEIDILWCVALGLLFDGFDGFGLRFSLRDGDHHGLDGQHAVFLGSRLRLVLLWLDDGRHVFLLGLRDGGIGIKLLPGFAQEIGISLVDLVAEVFKVLLHRLVEIVEVGVEVAHEIIERLIGIVLLRTFSLLDFLLARHGGRVARPLLGYLLLALCLLLQEVDILLGELDGGFLAVGGALLSILRRGGKGDQGKCNQ